jgi:putative intracellular protease/amidase
MRSAAASWLSGCLLAAGVAMGAEGERPELEALLAVSFDDTVEAAAEKDEVAVSGGEGIEFVEGRAGKAARFGEGHCVEYHGIPALDPKSATIELWVKPDFENRDLEDHYYLRLLCEDDSSGLDINFAATHCGPRAAMRAGEKIANAHADFASYAEKWNHIVVTWDHYDPDMYSLRLYVNGQIRAYADFDEITAPEVMRVGCKSAEEVTNAKAVLDEVRVYNRCLTELQVLALYESQEQGAQKLNAIRERVALDDATRRERMETLRNERKIAMVTGRTISGWNDTVFERLGIAPPPRIDEKEVEKADLGQYDVLLFPGGGGFELTDEGAEALREFVRQGGGYVGVCAGCYAARTYGLIEREYYPFRERGQVEVTLREHPVTEGFGLSRKLALPHANGPLIEAGDPATAPVVYKVGEPGYACVVAREYGEGRVVVFSAHPEGDNEGRPLIRNAILWAAKVTGMAAEGKENEGQGQ